MNRTTFKRVLVKEEIMILTKDRVEAVVLSQLLYWTKRVRDYKAMLSEEERVGQTKANPEAAPTHGWIFKAAEELAEETILGFPPSTVRRALIRLVEKGYLYERSNPNYAWDRTRQYRVNLTAIVQGLATLGILADSFSLLTDGDCPPQRERSSTRTARRIRHRACHSKHSERPIRHADQAVPEITPDITAKTESHPPTPSGRRVEYQSTSPDPRGQTSADPGLVSPSDPHFLTFWSLYPKQVGQLTAYRAWQSALHRHENRPVSAADLIRAAQNYAHSVADRAPRYILHPATFLGPDCRYLDSLSPPKAATSSTGSKSARKAEARTCWEQDYRPYGERSEHELVCMLNEMSPHFLPQIEPCVRQELQSRGFDACLPPGSLTYELTDFSS